MKLYIWINKKSTSDFQLEANVEMGLRERHSSNDHSGGMVILAESLEEAVRRATNTSEGREYLLTTSPKIIDCTKPGLVLYADGNC